MSSKHENEIHFVSQLKEGDMIDVFFYGKKIKNNCLVVKGLIVYLNGTSRETMDLENQDGLWVTKSEV